MVSGNNICRWKDAASGMVECFLMLIDNNSNIFGLSIWLLNA